MLTRRALPFFVSCFLATSVHAAAEASRQVDVPAGELPVAIRQLAEQTGVEFIYSVEEVRGIYTEGARGRYSAEKAVAKLVEGTGLQLTIHRSGALLISRTPALGQAPPTNSSAQPSGQNVEAGSPDSSIDSSLSRELIPEVIVTANRREESLSKVPISMTVWTRPSMDALGILDLADAAQFTPGMAISDKGNFVAISIRGIGSSGGAATTGIYVDDTPIQARALANSTSSQAMPVAFDLDRIEVLRGPQGTLFGAGSVGGTVRYITTQASLTTFSNSARAEVSSTAGGQLSYEVGVAAGGPLIDDELGVRASAWYRRDGGWIDLVDPSTFAPVANDNNYGESAAARIAATWAPTSTISLSANLLYQVRKLHDLNTYWDFLSSPENNQFVSAGPSRAPKDDSFGIAALKITGDLGAAQLISNTSVLFREDLNNADGTLAYLALYQAFGRPPDGIPLAGPDCTTGASCYPFVDGTGVHLPPGLHDYRVHSAFKSQQDAFTQELRLQSNNSEGPIEWTVGAFFSVGRTTTSQRDQDPDADRFFQRVFGITECSALGLTCNADGSTPLVDGDTTYLGHQIGEDRQLAGFGEIVWALNDRVKLTTGLRYSKLDFTSTSRVSGPINYGPSYSAGDEHQHAWTQRLGLSFQANAANFYYATFSTGFRPGGANASLSEALCAADLDSWGISDAPTSYQSDEVNSFELGAKNSFHDRLKLATSIYFTGWSNIQQSVTLPTCGSGYTANLGDAISEGGDISLEWAASDSIALRATLGYTDATYTKSVYAGSGTAPPLIEEGARIVSGQGTFSQPLPPWTLSAGAQYNFRAYDHRAFARFDYWFAGRNDGHVAGNDASTNQRDPYLRSTSARQFMSVRAGAEFGKLSAAFFIDNLFDSHPIASVNNTALYASDPQPPLSALFTYSTFRPRTFGLTFIYTN